jgi:serine/threonine-protein kinase RsbW
MIQSDPINEMVLTSSLESLSQVEVLIARFYGNNDHVEDCYGNILIALTEGVTNSILHGNLGDPTKQVFLNMEINSCEVSFTIKDEGVGFDFLNIPDPTLPENIEKLNGRGVFLMRHLADVISFEENGSIVKLTFTYLNS